MEMILMIPSAVLGQTVYNQRYVLEPSHTLGISTYSWLASLAYWWTASHVVEIDKSPTRFHNLEERVGLDFSVQSSFMKCYSFYADRTG